MKMELRRRALDKIYKRRDRIDMPDFQREEVWTEDQKRRLVDTILKGWHLPKFYFRRVDDSSFECVDGQQRLAAIFEFYDGKLGLESSVARMYGGPTYAKLKPDHSDAFDDFEIDIEEIEDATDDELKDLFVRLQLGTPLTTAEKLNALGGDARNFAHWIADQPFFEERLELVTPGMRISTLPRSGFISRPGAFSRKYDFRNWEHSSATTDYSIQLARRGNESNLH